MTAVRCEDVTGVAFAEAGGGWPSYLVQVNVGAAVLPGLASCGFVPVTQVRTPPPAARILTVVRRRASARWPSGIFGYDGSIAALVLISPLPAWPQRFDAMVHRRRGQVAVYVSAGPAHAGGRWRSRLLAAVEAGTVYGTRAVVVF